MFGEEVYGRWREWDPPGGDGVKGGEDNGGGSHSLRIMGRGEESVEREEGGKEKGVD